MGLALQEAEKVFEQAVAKSGQEERTLYDRLIASITEDDIPELQALSAKARLNKGISLAQENRLQEAITVFEKMQHLFAASPLPRVQALAAAAMVNRAFVLALQQNTLQALAAYDEVVDRFGDKESIELQEQVAVLAEPGEPGEGEVPDIAEAEEPEYEFDDVGEEDLDGDLDADGDDLSRQREADRRRDLERRRRVVYDEELGQTIAIRRRKRGGEIWSDEDEYL